MFLKRLKKHYQYICSKYDDIFKEYVYCRDDSKIRHLIYLRDKYFRRKIIVRDKFCFISRLFLKNFD